MEIDIADSVVEERGFGWDDVVREKGTQKLSLIHDTGMREPEMNVS